MTVQELMSQVDVNRVADAYILLDYDFSPDNFLSSLIEKYEAVPRLRKVIKETCSYFARFTPNDDTVPHTIFIISTPGYDFEKRWEKTLSCFAIRDNEVLPVLDKDFRIFDSKGEAMVSQFGLENIPIQNVASFMIAKSSLEKFGKEICAAKVLSELFFWGAFPEDRERKVKEFYERLSKPTGDRKLSGSKTLEEIIRERDKQLLASDSDSDEIAYNFAKKRFKEETKDIINRYRQSVNEKIHNRYIEAIKAEYKRR